MILQHHYPNCLSILTTNLFADMLSEYISIVAIMSYYTDPISDGMWKVFEKLCDAYVEYGEDFMEGKISIFIFKNSYLVARIAWSIRQLHLPIHRQVLGQPCLLEQNLQHVPKSMNLHILDLVITKLSFWKMNMPLNERCLMLLNSWKSFLFIALVELTTLCLRLFVWQLKDLRLLNLLL